MYQKGLQEAPHQSATSKTSRYGPMAFGAASLLVLSMIGHARIEAVGLSAACALFVWLFGAIMWGAVGVMGYAEALAHRLGEPLGTLILTLSAILIEVALIASVMMVGDANPTLARDTMFSVLMIILNGLVGLALLMGGIRHHQQTYNVEGARSFLVVLLPLAILALVLPTYTVARHDPSLSPAQGTIFALLTILLYGVFLAMQTRRHIGYFAEVETPSGVTGAHAHGSAKPYSTLVRDGALLILTLVPVALLAHHLAGVIEFGIKELQAPPALAGALVAALILAPEGMTALKAAWRNQLQRSVNIMLGSALSTIGLTVPVVLIIALAINTEIILGLEPENALLLGLTVLVSSLTFSGSRTDMLKGAVHLVLFAVYLMLLVLP
jgi:Ca2+:H+ antiporter